jgi:hypothetical protein
VVVSADATTASLERLREGGADVALCARTRAQLSGFSTLLILISILLLGLTQLLQRSPSQQPAPGNEPSPRQSAKA